MDYPTLDNVYLGNKRVFLRVGFDVPLDQSGNIVDDSRIRFSLPTIKYILEHGASQLVIATHIGRPKNREWNLRTDKVAERLSSLLSMPVKKLDGFGEDGIPKPEVAKIVMLENLRFDTREKDKDVQKRDDFGMQLACLADVYVNDAFSNCHRDHASMTSIPKFIPGCLGMGVAKEVSTILSAMDSPERPFVAVIGGVKADKLNAVSNLLGRVDKIMIAGALAFTLLKEFGKKVGNTKVDDEGLAEFRETVDKVRSSSKVLLPVDCVIADSFSADATSRVVSVDEIPDGWMALDIGPASVDMFRKEISGAKTAVWNGPIGVFEFERFSHGTKDIAEAISKINGKSVIGGGDSGAAVEKLGLKEKFTLVSSGGGVSLELFEGKKLPALEALKRSIHEEV